MNRVYLICDHANGVVKMDCGSMEMTLGWIPENSVHSRTLIQFHNDHFLDLVIHSIESTVAANAKSKYSMLPNDGFGILRNGRSRQHIVQFI